MKDKINKIKQSKETGKPILGLSLYSFSPTVAEVAGYSGADYLFIDNEHTPASWETLENIVRACDISSATSMIRVDKQYPGYPSNIRRAFEIGAGMVIVPHINSKNEAISVVRAAKFGPDWVISPYGDQIRGTGLLSRSGRYGNISLDDWVKMENEENMVSIMLEEERAIKNAEEILSVEGLDQFIIGFSDLTTNLGIPGDTNNRKIKELEKEIKEVENKYSDKFIKSTNLSFIEAFKDEEKFKSDIKKKLEDGVRMFTLTHDLNIIRIVLNKCKKLLEESYHEYNNKL